MKHLNEETIARDSNGPHRALQAVEYRISNIESSILDIGYWILDIRILRSALKSTLTRLDHAAQKAGCRCAVIESA